MYNNLLFLNIYLYVFLFVRLTDYVIIINQIIIQQFQIVITKYPPEYFDIYN